MLFEKLIWEPHGRPQGANPTIHGVLRTRGRRIVGLAPCGRPWGLFTSLFRSYA